MMKLNRDIYQNILIFVLAAILMYLLVKTDRKEMMSNVRSKECSQRSINDAYQYWVFGSPKFVR